MLYAPYEAPQPNDPSAVTYAPPPIMPVAACGSCSISSGVPYSPGNYAGAMPSPVGGAGQPANTLAGGVPTAPPTPVHLISPTITGAPTASGATAPTCGCGGAMSAWPLWVWLLLAVGAIALIKRA